MSPRFLITGTRSRPRETLGTYITGALYLVEKFYCPEGGELVHGAARGVDEYGADVWTSKGLAFTEKDFPYKRELAKAGGPARNSEMVNYIKEQEAPSLCLGFPIEGSRGTYDCANKARRAGIPTFILTSAEDFKKFLAYLRQTYPDSPGISMV